MVKIILRENIQHPNDRSFTFARLIFPVLLHKYLKLPGDYVESCQTTVITRDMRKLEMDWLLYVKADNNELFENILINVEQQTKPVRMDKIKDIADYRDYAKTLYGLPVLTIILTNENPKYSLEKYEITESDIIKPKYIHFSWGEIEKRLNNLKTKIKNNIKLNENETLDIAFLPMFSPKKKGKSVTEDVCSLFKIAEFENKKLKEDIAPILEVMINRYCENPNEKEELILMTIDEILENAHKKMREIDEKEIQKQKEKVERLKQETEELTQQTKELTQQTKELTQKTIDLEKENLRLKKENEQLKELAK